MATKRVPSLTLKGVDLVDVLRVLARSNIDLAVMLAKQAGCGESDLRIIDPNNLVKY